MIDDSVIREDVYDRIRHVGAVHDGLEVEVVRYEVQVDQRNHHPGVNPALLCSSVFVGTQHDPHELDRGELVYLVHRVYHVYIYSATTRNV